MRFILNKLFLCETIEGKNLQSLVAQNIALTYHTDRRIIHTHRHMDRERESKYPLQGHSKH
jgi:hypothetical protein